MGLHGRISGTAAGAPVGDRLKAELGAKRLAIFVMPWTWELLGRGGLAGTRGGCAPLCSSGAELAGDGAARHPCPGAVSMRRAEKPGRKKTLDFGWLTN
jgi:hypothetical protein